MNRAVLALALALFQPGIAVAATDAPAPAAIAISDTTMATNTVQVTARGTRFIAPRGWRVRGDGRLFTIEAQEAGSRMVVADAGESGADAAVAAAWVAAGLPVPTPAKPVTDIPAPEGWLRARTFDYTHAGEPGRVVRAQAYESAAGWTVVLTDVAKAVHDKRRGQLATVTARLFPAGYQPESFAGRTAHRLDESRVQALADFIRMAQRELAIPGIAIGLVQDGRTVFAGGFGVREIGRPAQVDADTRFAIGSNTKALTTLMLARLVAQGRFAWDTPVVDVLPGFRIGDADAARRMQVQHLVCACTGLPRQDMEWWYEYADATPASKVAELARMMPTSGFGEMYQYSNPLAAAGGYIGAHALFPGLELGQAYDRAMREHVFDPLGMRDTTLDFRQAQTGNVVSAHGEDVEGIVTALAQDANDSAIAMRPAGGVWSTANDMLRYLRMELDGGRLPDGSRYIDAALLGERTREKVPDGPQSSYGMGLSTDHSLGTPVVYHGGAMSGMLSDMIWLPGHGVGAVILTNSDSGGHLLAPFRRKLLELLFDGRPLADMQVTDAGKSYREHLAAERKRVTLPGDPRILGKLAPRYRHPSLGLLDVRRIGGRTVLDFGEWRSDAATRAGEDGAEVVRLVSPGLVGVEYVLGTNPSGRTLTITQGTQAYVFEEAH